MEPNDLNRGAIASNSCGFRRSSATLLSLFFIASLPQVYPQEPQNPLPNPGFEIDDNGDGDPDGWTFAWKYTHSGERERGVEKQEPDSRWDEEVVHSGNRSLFISNHLPQDDCVWTADDIPVTAGNGAYRLGAWIRTRDMRDTEALAGGVFLDKDGTWLGADYTTIAVKDDRD